MQKSNTSFTRGLTLVAVAVACLALFPASAFAARPHASDRPPGARSAMPALCASSVKVSLRMAYAAKAREYRVSGLSVRGLRACSGNEIRIDLVSASSASLGHVTHGVSPADARANSLVLPLRGSVEVDAVYGVSVTLVR